MSEAWRGELKAARRGLKLTQKALAERAGISLDAVRGYENGRRRPSKAQLEKLLTLLAVPSAEANEILHGAGFAANRTLFPVALYDRYFYTVAELRQAVEAVPWPEFSMNDRIEVVAANTAARALWDVDDASVYEAPRATRNLLSVASDRRFADRVLNWDECIGVIAAVSKGRPQQPHSLDEPDTYFNDVLARFADGDPAFLERLLRVWAATPPAEAKVRWTYNVAWQDPEFGVMRFLATVSTASEPDALSFNDWIPVDATSWEVLARVLGARAGRA